MSLKMDEVEIIQITDRSVLGDAKYRMYSGASGEEVVQSFHSAYGVYPARVYVYTNKAGLRTAFALLQEERSAESGDTRPVPAGT